MKYDHNKAKQILIKYNTNNQLSVEILNRVNKSSYLFQTCEKEGALMTYGQSPYGIIKNPDFGKLLVTTAEIIYNSIISNPELKNQVIQEETNNDDLFDFILANLFHGLKGLEEEEETKIAGDIGDLYDVEF